jgi:hypothetical protein
MRPPSQGDSAIGLDCERLSAILRRVTADERRGDEEKKEISKLIKRLMKLLLERSDKVPRSKRNGSRAHSV